MGTHVSCARVCPSGHTSGAPSGGRSTEYVLPGSETVTVVLHGGEPAAVTLMRCSPGSTGMGVSHAVAGSFERSRLISGSRLAYPAGTRTTTRISFGAR